MASVSYNVKSAKQSAQIYLRFTNGRATEFMCGTGLYINPQYWDPKKKRIRNVVAVPNRDSVNSKLSKLETFVLDRFNEDFSDGGIIDKDWLLGCISDFFKRPKGETKKEKKEHLVYFDAYCQYWLNEHAHKWKVKPTKYLDEKGKYYYQQVADLFKEFQDKQIENVRRYKIKDVDYYVIDLFLDFLQNDKMYGGGTVDLFKSKIRFFCNRADEVGLPVNKNFKQALFSRKEDEDYKEPYLNDDEIEAIFNHDFSYNQKLLDTRDLLIIGVNSGLRVSDFNQNLEIANFKDNVIKIKTQKTNRWVTIPIHWMVKCVLERRNGSLPPKMPDFEFNIVVKEIARICGIKQEMKGGLMNPETRRKEIGVYPKYKLVSSHICRRSFATNNYGIVDNKVLMDIGGWETEKIFLNYIKKSDKETANELAVAWNKKYATNQKLINGTS